MTDNTLLQTVVPQSNGNDVVKTQITKCNDVQGGAAALVVYVLGAALSIGIILIA